MVQRCANFERGAERATFKALKDHPLGSNIKLLATGKAGGSVMKGMVTACSHLGVQYEGLIATPYRLSVQIPNIRPIYGTHPVPDFRSIAAGEQIKQFVANTQTDLICATTGGGSAGTVSTCFLSSDELTQVYKALL